MSNSQVLITKASGNKLSFHIMIPLVHGLQIKFEIHSLNKSLITIKGILIFVYLKPYRAFQLRYELTMPEE